MKTIIAGSRGIDSVMDVLAAMADSGFEITEVVSGGAKGVDLLGELLAASSGIPVRRFPAEWDRHGKSAGPIRNIQMAEYADALIAIWDGKSRGTKHMIDQAKRRNLKVFVRLAS